VGCGLEREGITQGCVVGRLSCLQIFLVLDVCVCVSACVLRVLLRHY
jgi:hypothetical protein